jgi:hypothetical protein
VGEDMVDGWMVRWMGWALTTTVDAINCNDITNVVVKVMRD